MNDEEGLVVLFPNVILTSRKEASSKLSSFGFYFKSLLLQESSFLALYFSSSTSGHLFYFLCD